MLKMISLLFFIISVFSKKYSRDISSLSVSGISSGGYMAIQMGVAFSSRIDGTGIVAGGPFYCSQDKGSTTAQMACMAYAPMIDLNSIQTAMTKFEKEGSIDKLENLKKNKFYIFAGKMDYLVNPEVGKTLEKQLVNKLGVEKSNIKTVYTYDASHAWITDNFGNKCSYLGDPYINNCNYDQAGDILKFIHFKNTTMIPKTKVVSGNFKKFDQSNYGGISMGSYGVVYIPTACQSEKNNKIQFNESCSIHVNFHGCEQYAEKSGMGDKYYTHTELNEWAESNNLAILYPQTQMLSSSNPKGCWDWWGYTNKQYPLKTGNQMKIIMQMVDDLINGNLPFIN